MKTLTVKPGKAYLLVAAILFAMVLACFLALLFSDAVRGSDNPAESLRLALLLRFLLLLALLLRRVLRTLRGFLAAIGLTVHVPACLSLVKAGRDEQCPHLYRYGHHRCVSHIRSSACQ